MMHIKFKEIIKRNPFIRRLGKKVNILRAYYHDVKDFNDYYNESAEVQNEFSYSIMLLVHSLEKGMCMKEIRPYGFQKVNELKKNLKKTADVSAFEYQLGVAVLEAWVRLFRENNWTDYQEYKDTEAFIADKHSELLAGRKLYEPNGINFKSYFDFIASRHSVREFQEAEISEKDVEIALECFRETPTACNRQMCRVIEVKSTDIKEQLSSALIGIQGFDRKSVNYFVITYDLASLAYSGERQQGFFNAGLCAMNFINGLHSRGIGSCCLQWSNNYTEDTYIRKLLNLRKSERIAVVIGAGYYLNHNIIPCSCRRSITDLLRVV